jgi:hypothetical protein
MEGRSRKGKRRRERGSRVSGGGEENKGADKEKRERILGKSRNRRTLREKENIISFRKS